jgi:hypothetical protein
MPLKIGAPFGPYEIVALLGVGGMGEVYRARDPRLARDVAIKVLPDTFTNDSDRLARFQREAQVLASLNHPNIAAIYGLEEAGGVRGLVLELVEGLTIADRLKAINAGLPLDEVLVIARQVAEALEAAHDRGIVHRDLKPANIKVRPDGVVKVLDFGLAKLTAPPEGGAAGGSPLYSQMPTLSSPAMSRVGVILGTAAYMSPEQARGGDVDKRTDIWAFGCVLFEMLTGKRAFAGEDVTDTLAEVLKGDVAWTALPAATPESIRRLLRRCLTRERKARLADLGSARLDINDATSDIVEKVPRRNWVAVAAFSAFAIVVSASAALMYSRPTEPPAPPVQAEIVAPPGWLIGGGRGVVTGVSVQVVAEQRFAISPDGRQLAFVAADQEGRRLLWIRPLDQGSARPLQDTEDAAELRLTVAPQSPFAQYRARHGRRPFRAARGIRRAQSCSPPPRSMAAPYSSGVSQPRVAHRCPSRRSMPARKSNMSIRFFCQTDAGFCIW